MGNQLCFNIRLEERHSIANSCFRGQEGRDRNGLVKESLPVSSFSLQSVTVATDPVCITGLSGQENLEVPLISGFIK